jgi:hypothetical protein
MKKLIFIIVIIAIIAIVIWYRKSKKQSETTAQTAKSTSVEVTPGNYKIEYTGEKKFSGVTGLYLEAGKQYMGAIDQAGNFTTKIQGGYGMVPVFINKGLFKVVSPA